MKTSVNWLRAYVDMPWPAAELAERLTLAGLEVEGIVALGNVPEGVVVGRIVKRDAHPNADRLSVCEVDDGSGELKQVVCGAANCDAGKLVPLAQVGAVLPGGLKIKPAKLRGVPSYGMLCAAADLGLAATEHSGLLELSTTAAPGTPLAQVIATDTVIDWEVTPNRPDWLSHVGIAREIAAVGDCRASFRLPPADLKPVAGTDVQALAKVVVTAADLCPRYTARVIRNVKIGPSPSWMQQALRAIGIRPISNVVDITNYVMAECGQPLHAFDYDLVAEHAIVVRRAEAGETLVTLDGQVRQLNGDTLVIADAAKGVALAGIMGGGNSEISAATTTVLLESAAFEPSNIRATARRLLLSTESSHRFERGVGLEMVEFASARAAALICELAGGELVDGVIDVCAQAYVAPALSCRVARVNSLLGLELSAEQIAALFERLQFAVVECNATTVTVQVPSFRLDLTREVDLIEEVARLHGLDNIPAATPVAQLAGERRLDAWYPVEQMRAQLLALGLSEAMNYSLISVEAATRGTGVDQEHLVRLANPISVEGAVLRPSLLPGLLQNLQHNVAHQNNNVSLFELGRVIVQQPALAEERLQVGILLSGRPHPERYGAEQAREYDFFDLKGLLESWMATRRLAELSCQAHAHPAFAPGACAAFVSGGKVVARFGQINPELVSGIRLQHPALLALIEGDVLLAAATAPKLYKKLPQFPATERDISLLAPASVSNGDIIACIEAANCPLIEQVRLFDVYEDEAVLGAGKRSLAYSLTYRGKDRTLVDDEVNAAHQAVRAKLEKDLAVQLR